MFINTCQIPLNRILHLAKQLVVFMPIVYSASLYAWLDNPNDLGHDIIGDDSPGACASSLKWDYESQICHKVELSINQEIIQLDRCDTQRQAYIDPPNICHRWNLIWQYGNSVNTNSWPDSAASDYRLPTFKELTKLALNDDVSSSIVGSWFDPSTNFENVWLISSSYAKGTGTCGNHIYGVNASTGLTGRFKLIDVDVDDGAGGTTTETQWRMLEGTMLDSCNYAEGEPRVHALIVNKSTVKELM